MRRRLAGVLRRTLQITLVVLLLGTAVAKLLAWNSAAASLDLENAKLAAATCIEILGGVALILGFTRVASTSILVLAVAGVVHSRIRVPESRCGCVGDLVELNPAGELILASSLGLLCCLFLLARSASSSERTRVPRDV